MTAPAIELKGISKAYGPVQANKDISISVAKGTIHGIVGENGAGKSTLMSILYGFYKADAGEVFINGQLTPIPDSQAAIRAGSERGSALVQLTVDRERPQARRFYEGLGFAASHLGMKLRLDGADGDGSR